MESNSRFTRQRRRSRSKLSNSDSRLHSLFERGSSETLLEGSDSEIKSDGSVENANVGNSRSGFLEETNSPHKSMIDQKFVWKKEAKSVELVGSFTNVSSIRSYFNIHKMQ
jgi:hypothetical protein